MEQRDNEKGADHDDRTKCGSFIHWSRLHSGGSACEVAAPPRLSASEDVSNLQTRCVRLRLSCRAKTDRNKVRPVVGGGEAKSKRKVAALLKHDS